MLSKKDKLWIVFGFSLVLVLSSLVTGYGAQFTLNANIPFSTTVYTCEDSNCTGLTDQTNTVSSGTSNSLIYTVPGTGPGYFAEYSYASCKVPQLGRFQISDTSQNEIADISFSKKTSCESGINSLSLSSESINEGSQVTITANINPAVNYGAASLEVIPIPSEIDSYYSTRTMVKLRVKENGQQVYFDSKEVDVPWGKPQSVPFSFQPANNGNFVVEVETEPIDCQCENSNSLTLTKNLAVVDLKPIAVAKADKTTVLEGEEVIFNASESTSPFDSIASYSWNFTDGTPLGTGAALTHTFATQGTYNVEVTVKDSDGSESKANITIEVEDSKPIAVAGQDQTVVEGDIVFFDASGSSAADGIAKYEWIFGDGSPKKEGEKVNHTYNTPNTYTVTLTVTDGDGSTNVSSLIVNVQQKTYNTHSLSLSSNTPFQISAVFCEADAQDLCDVQSTDENGNLLRTDATTGTSNFLNYEMTVYKPEVFVEFAYAECKIPQIGRFGIDLFTSDSSSNLQFTQKENATAAINSLSLSASTVDEGNQVTITANINPAVNYGAKSFEMVEIPSNLEEYYSTETLVTLRIKDANGGLLDTQTKTVNISWGTPQDVSFDYTPYQQGSYITEMETDVTDCAASSTIKQESSTSFTANDLGPTSAQATSDLQSVDEGVEVTFNVSVDSHDSIVSYDWDFDDGQSKTGQSVKHMFSTDLDKVFNVTVTASDGEDTIIDSVEVTVKDLEPSANANADKVSVNEGETVTFNSTGSSSFDLATFAWDFGDHQSEVGQLVTHEFSVSQQKTFNVTLTLTDSDKDVSTNNVEVTVSDTNPAVEAGQDQTAKKNQLVSFDASGTVAGHDSIVSYDWDFGDGNSDTGLQVNHTYTSTGTKTVTLTVKDTDSQSQDTLIVIVTADKPTALFTAPDSAVEGQEVSFIDASTQGSDLINSWSWDFGDQTSIETSQDANHTFQQNGVYIVKLTVSDGTDSDTFSKNITINDTKPTVSLTGPSEVFEDIEAATFTSTATAHDGVSSYEWDFSYDGSTFNPEAGFSDAEENFTFSDPGAFLVAVRAIDGDGSTKIATYPVTVKQAIVDLSVDTITHEKEGSTVYLFDTVVVTSQVSNLGNQNNAVTVRLKDGNSVVDSEQVTLTAGESKNVNLSWIPSQKGSRTLTVEILPLQGEISVSNNQKSIVEEVVSVRDSVSLEFANVNSLPSSTESANTDFFVLVRLQNSGEDLQGFKLSLNPAGTTVIGNGDSNSDTSTIKTFNPLGNGDTRSFYWLLQASGGSHTISVTIGNPGDDMVVSRTVNIA